jgi:organic hydroperoxide reductase OsmC/OhrA
VTDKRHTYSIRVDWTGNQGAGTSAYRAFSRAHEISAQGKTAIAGSSDPVFRGDAARWNPAELLVAALSACHQLWYLHLCADAGIVCVNARVARKCVMAGRVNWSRLASRKRMRRQGVEDRKDKPPVVELSKKPRRKRIENWRKVRMLTRPSSTER